MKSMMIDTDKMTEGIKMLNGYLSEYVVTVNFTKKDGTDRKMRCTRRMDLIPLDKQPKPKIDPIVGGVAPGELVLMSSGEAHDLQLFKVWDLDKQAWRSFRYTTINSMMIVE